jgi:hypothetical protein
MVAFCPGTGVSTRTGLPSRAATRIGSAGMAKTRTVKDPTRSLNWSTKMEWVPAPARPRVSYSVAPCGLHQAPASLAAGSWRAVAMRLSRIWWEQAM